MNSWSDTSSGSQVNSTSTINVNCTGVALQRRRLNLAAGSDGDLHSRCDVYDFPQRRHLEFCANRPQNVEMERKR